MENELFDKFGRIEIGGESLDVYSNVDDFLDTCRKCMYYGKGKNPLEEVNAPPPQGWGLP